MGMPTYGEAYARSLDEPPFSNEEWRDVPNYEGAYEVSDLGRVRSMDRVTIHGHRARGRVLKQCRDPRGYMCVALWSAGKGRTWSIHQLVAAAFLGPRTEGQEVLHGPGGQIDNRRANLSYGTSQQNSDDELRDGTRPVGVERWNARLTPTLVLECRRRHAAGESQRSLAREFGMSLTVMHNAIRGATGGR